MGTVVEELLYHCTSPSNAAQIARHNIDWRLTRRSRYGKGACFSKSPCYASMKAGATGAFIICKVLMRAVQSIHYVNYSLKIPCEGYDTTSGNRGNVIVKYDDYTFYPEYIVYYRN
ncbi:Poly(ADP-ribose) polymerase, catalytic domain [Cinara cedri]|uniref:Poly(ADP-ribose) polymerase, catalytic domain n=1 Tax=Cinara cedri TaxID=506608 RepID=A0A5E4NBK5_9HEMI|nr:Poly(ADP-ribose) polymerase, catalytic domain [Cinara cedri]